MQSSPDKTLLSRLTVWKYADSVMLVAAVIAIVGAVAAALGRLNPDPGWAGAAALFAAVSGAVVLSLLRRGEKRDEPPRSTKHFQPFAKLAELTPWDREAELDRLGVLVDGDVCQFILVTGASGAGKSVLLQKLLPARLGDKVKVVPIWSYYDYGEFRAAFENALSADRAADEPSRRVVVLDQFEQYLAWFELQTAAFQSAEQEWFARVLDAGLAGRALTVIVSVRKEWYYDLGWLGPLIPAPSGCVDVSPKEFLAGDSETDSVVERFTSVVKQGELAIQLVTAMGRGGQVWLPLEIQIAGAAVEQRYRTNHEEAVAPFLTGGPDGVRQAIDAYFDRIVKGADDRRVAMKILFALSAQTRFRTPMDETTLLNALFEERSVVLDNVAYLARYHLVEVSDDGYYEVTHDYIAEFFRQESGSVLDPIERDNVLFHVGHRGRLSSIVASSEEREAARGWGFGRVTIYVLGLLILARLLDFGLPWVRLKHGPQAHPLFQGGMIDRTYLPSFFPLLLWVIYFGSIYDLILRHLHEGFWAKWFSRFTMIFLAICVVATTVAPAVWALAIALSGFVIGLKVLSKMRLKGLSDVVKEWLKAAGVVTTLNMFFLGVGGAIGLWATVKWVRNRPAAGWKIVPRTADWTVGSSVVSVMLVYVCWTLWKAHGNKMATARTLGLLARASGGTVQRPSASEPIAERLPVVAEVDGPI